MNRAILRLFVLVMVLFGLLVAFTSRWTVFEAGSLRSNALNRRQLLEAQRVHRGRIIAADGTVLARSLLGSGGVYHRTYPKGGLFAHAVGYAYITIGNAALERSRNDALTGQRTTVNTILDQLRGRQRQGDDVVTTLDPKAQQVAISQLAGRKGAVVALDPRTGAVKVLASAPRYDPRTLARPGVFGTLSQDTSRSPLLDRVTQSGYPPGSTFKVVTAIAALDSGRFTPTSTVNGDNAVRVSGVPLNNDFNQSFGPVDLTTALTKSINTVWAQVAVSLGRPTMARYMERLGFDSQPPLDLPSDALRPSGEFRGRRLLSPTSSLVDVGRMGIGQDKLNVTPLQMAMVASAVANRGRLVAPHLADRLLDRDGRTVARIAPRPVSQVMKPQTARAVGQMMSQVVQEGTGTAAALSGVQVAGKTGTAEIVPGQSINQVWFIAFAPLDHPRVAIAATIERSDGQGGTVAAPVAKAVIESLLHG